MEIRTRNVNTALSEALWALKSMGIEDSSRNGPVIVFPEPVMTTYTRPNERVLFCGERDANPIFHLLESVWMLAGRDDVEFPKLFNSTIGQFSDNGQRFNAAYGYRWRRHFGRDQLVDVIELLKRDPKTRQAVVQIWDPYDLVRNTKDKACNTQIFFEIRSGELNMTVINRSNDLWWGCYGANAVHFSILHEFVAHAVGVNLGMYRQFSHNLHLYTELYDAKKHLDIPPMAEHYDMYTANQVKPLPIMTGDNWGSWLSDAEEFCVDPFSCKIYHNDFFMDVAYPMAMISRERKLKRSDGTRWLNMIAAEDWRMACGDWIERRESAKKL